MSHNLFGGRFVSDRVPAWHKLGLVLDQPITATEAWRLAGPYQVELEDLVTSSSNILTGQKAIVRMPCKGDLGHRVFAIVGSGYRLVTPDQFVEVWDRHVKARIETLGALGYGERFFVSTKLPSFDVKGDEIDNYLLGISPMTGKDAMQIRVTPVRVVCQNTLIAAQQQSTETYRVRHTGDVIAQLGQWMEQVWDLAEAKSESLREAFEILADKRITGGQFVGLVEAIYPEPPEPKEQNLNPQDAATQSAKLEKTRKAIYQVRQAVKGLFEGEGTGTDRSCMKGTCWGYYNAVVEYEDYGRQNSVPDWSLFGQGAQIKEKAFNEALKIAKGLLTPFRPRIITKKKKPG